MEVPGPLKKTFIFLCASSLSEKNLNQNSTTKNQFFRNVFKSIKTKNSFNSYTTVNYPKYPVFFAATKRSIVRICTE